MHTRTLKETGRIWILLLVMCMFAVNPAVGVEAALETIPVEDCAKTESLAKEACAPTPGRRNVHSSRLVTTRPHPLPAADRSDHRPVRADATLPGAAGAPVPLRC